MTQTDDPLVDEVAGQIRRLFVQAYRNKHLLLTGKPTDWGARPMSSWDGGFDAQANRNCRPAWPKMARICLDHQFRPERFVAAQFAGRDRMPWANQCCGPEAIERCRQDEQDAGRELARALAGQKHTMAIRAVFARDFRGLGPRDAVAAVLADPSLDLSGLYRHVVAAAYGYPDIAARYRPAALLQYVFQRDAYDRLWVDPPIPEDLRREAAAALAGGAATARRKGARHG